MRKINLIVIHCSETRCDRNLHYWFVEFFVIYVHNCAECAILFQSLIFNNFLYV